MINSGSNKKNSISMTQARLLVVVIGFLLPYLARLAGGLNWLWPYLDGGWGGFLLLSGFNAIAWLSVLGISFLYKRPVSLLAPALPGFGLLALGHYLLDLSADAQSAIALVFFPIYALVPIGIGGIIGYLIDRHLRKSASNSYI